MSDSTEQSNLENQFSLVENLLQQQDEVILQLDELNGEIEGLIKQLASERAAELGEVVSSDEPSTAKKAA